MHLVDMSSLSSLFQAKFGVLQYIAWDVKWRQQIYCSQAGCSSKNGIQRQRTVPELKSAYVNWKFWLFIFNYYF